MSQENQTPEDGEKKHPQSVTMRFKIDRKQREAIQLKDNRSIALLWGQEIDPATGNGGKFCRAKLWNRAGVKLLEILKERDVTEKNPLVIDLTGVMKKDQKDQKDILEASFFSIVGEPKRERGDRGENKPEAGGQEEKPKKAREKREFEHDIAIAGILDVRTEKDGALVVDLAGMKKEEWDKASREDRENDAKLFRIQVSGDIAKIHEGIEKAANWEGPYMDLSNAVVIRAKGTWDKLADSDPAKGAYRPFVFRPSSAEIVGGPNHQAKEAKKSQPEMAL